MLALSFIIPMSARRNWVRNVPTDERLDRHERPVAHGI